MAIITHSISFDLMLFGHFNELNERNQEDGPIEWVLRFIMHKV